MNYMHRRQHRQYPVDMMSLSASLILHAAILPRFFLLASQFLVGTVHPGPGIGLLAIFIGTPGIGRTGGKGFFGLLQALVPAGSTLPVAIQGAHRNTAALPVLGLVDGPQFGNLLGNR